MSWKRIHRHPATWAAAAALATIQAVTGAVGAVAGWLLAHASGVFAVVTVTGTSIAPHVGWLPPTEWWAPAIVAAGLLLVAGYLWRWTGGASS